VNLAEELENGSYRPGDYRYFKIYEPKERMVAAWNNDASNLPASNRNNNTPTNQNVGFRVARPPARPKETRGVSQV
jgi:hypothetical protein